MSRTVKKLLIAFLLLIISFFHYSAQPYHSALHVLHREMYLLPILFAAYWFGKNGGLIVAITASVVFLPKVLIEEPISSALGISNAVEILTFLIVGYLLGHFQDVRHAHWRTFFKSAEIQTGGVRPRNGARVMVCIDHSPMSNKAAQYLSDTFLKLENTEIVVLGFIREPSRDLFADAKQYQSARSENEQNVTALVEEAHRILVEGGFPGNAVTTRVVRIQKESLAARIIEEQRRLACDTVVVHGIKMSKTEELILGNPAVKLIREADFSVVTVF